MKKLISLISCVLVSSNAIAQTNQVYSGAILTSTRGVESVSAFNFSTLRQEKLSSTSMHIIERKVDDSKPKAYTRSTSLCRKASIRRMQKQSKNRLVCSPNVALTAVEVPTDPMFDRQSGLKMMAAPGAWDVTTGSSDLLAIVIDSGIDATHPDLKNNMWVNPKEIANNGIDDDKNGYIDDVYGANTITNVGSGIDDNGHGTHVAGILGAVGNNFIGISGVTQKVKLVSVKFLSSSGSGSTSNAIKAINYGVQLKQLGYNVVVMNNSYGSALFSSALLTAVKSANQAGILFAAAAGNSGVNNDAYPFYPSSLDSPNVISVASVETSGALSSYSNYGKLSVDIAAPGSAVWSTLPYGGYGYKSGTSMATPHIAGLAILTKAACLSLTSDQLKTNILTNGISNSNLTTKVLSGSVANAVGSVYSAKQNCETIPTNTPTPTPTNTQVVDPIVATPTPTPTPTFTITPTATPTNTPTATPTATPTPAQTPYVRFSERSVSSFVTLAVDMSVGNLAVKYANLQFVLRDRKGVLYACPSKTVSFFYSNQKTINVTMSNRIVYFDNINVLLKAPSTVASDKISIVGTGTTTDIASEVKYLCIELNGQVS